MRCSIATAEAQHLLHSHSILESLPAGIQDDLPNPFFPVADNLESLLPVQNILRRLLPGINARFCLLVGADHVDVFVLSVFHTFSPRLFLTLKLFDRKSIGRPRWPR